MATFLVGADAGIADDGQYGGGYIVLAKFTASTTGALTEVRVKGAGTFNAKVAIYADSSGEPGSLLGSNQAGVACTAGWNTISLTGVDITASTIYWLAVNTDAAAGNGARFLGSGGTARYKVLDYTSAFPDPAGSGYTNANWTGAIAGWGTTGSASAGTNSRMSLLGVGI